MHLSEDSAQTLLRAEVQASGNRAAMNERIHKGGSIPTFHATVIRTRPTAVL
jgi:hypothetical protein